MSFNYKKGVRDIVDAQAAVISRQVTEDAQERRKADMPMDMVAAE